jgi:hypothetical protein
MLNALAASVIMYYKKVQLKLLAVTAIFGLMRRNDYKTLSLLNQHANNYPDAELVVIFDSYDHESEVAADEVLHNEYHDHIFRLPKGLRILGKQEVCGFAAEKYNINLVELFNAAEGYKPLWYLLIMIYIKEVLSHSYAVLTDDDIAACEPVTELQYLVKHSLPFFIPETGAGVYEQSIIDLIENKLKRTIYYPQVRNPLAKGINAGFAGIDLACFSFGPLEFRQIIDTFHSELSWAKWQTFLVLLCFSFRRGSLETRLPLILDSWKYLFAPFSDPICFTESKLVHCVATQDKRPLDHVWSTLNPTLNARRHWIVINYLRDMHVDSILELGVDDGATARMMLVNTFKSDPYYLGIDLFEDTYVDVYRSSLKDRPNHSKESLARSLKLYSKNATLIKGDTSTSLENLDSDSHPPFQLCFIDGDHSYEGVKKDFFAAIPHLSSGGIVFIDDFTESPEIPGVKQFVEELVLSEEFHVAVVDDPSDEYRGYKFSVVRVQPKSKINIFVV